MSDLIDFDFNGMDIPMTKELHESLDNRAKLLGVSMFELARKIVSDPKEVGYGMFENIVRIEFLLKIYSSHLHSDELTVRELKQIISQESHEVCIDEYDKEIYWTRCSNSIKGSHEGLWIPLTYVLLTRLHHLARLVDKSSYDYVKDIINEKASQKIIKSYAFTLREIGAVYPDTTSHLIAIFHHFQLNYKDAIRSLCVMAEDDVCVLPSFFYRDYKELA